jgi:hypothetical protein
MSNPYSTQTITGYNSAPPADDGSQVATNEITWAKHKTKLGDPVKTLSEAINTELLSAFGLIFGQEISVHSSNYTVIAGDQGKFLSVTGTTTITLIAAATAGSSFALAIINNGTGTVTVDGSGAETINGSTTITLNSGEAIILTCNGALWVGLATNKTTLYDSAGNESIKTVATASAVNEITITNSATGNAVDISATGTDTNIDLTLTPKGIGEVIVSGGGSTTISGSAVSSMTVSGLDGNYISGYRVEGYIKSITSGSNITLVFNGDTTAGNYDGTVSVLSSSYTQNLAGNNFIGAISTSAEGPITIDVIQEPTGGVVLAIVTLVNTGTAIYQGMIRYNTTDNITSIGVHRTSTHIDVGSFLIVKKAI